MITDFATRGLDMLRLAVIVVNDPLKSMPSKTETVSSIKTEFKNLIYISVCLNKL